MKINEVEALVGVTKKNIRFYEEQGLLSPQRNAANGYRDYGEGEVAALRQIKLLRKLGVPIAEIRQMQEGVHTVGDGMRRHLITLERERQNLEQAQKFCERLRDHEGVLSELDAGALLGEMERMEQSGATFQDKQKQDVRLRYVVAPVAVTVVMVSLMVSLSTLVVWSWSVDPASSPPLWLILTLAALPVVFIGGLLMALFQRIRELWKGEFDDAKRY